MRRQVFCSLLLVVAALLAATAANAQRTAILTPDNSEKSSKVAEMLADRLAASFKVLDSGLAESAYRSSPHASPFNMTISEARNLGAVIGCDAFLLVKADTQRRSAFQRPEYYEAYASIFVVSTGSGRLLKHELASFEEPTPSAAAQRLMDAIPAVGDALAGDIKRLLKDEIDAPDKPAMEEVPDEGSPAAKAFRAPIPYRRIKPEYNSLAALYDVTATVEIELDIAADGSITRHEIARWAGFKLDEEVVRAVTSMNWRPAERNGKSLPMRVLLRYNFKKIDKEK